MEYMTVCLCAALAYPLLEMLWRGRTHWTMMFCGGLCFTLMYIISPLSFAFSVKCLLSAAAVTAVEFFTGCLVNLRLHWAVWDYSGARFNLLGQVCPAYCLMWLLLSAPALRLCERLHALF